MNLEFFTAIIRHIFSALGAYLVTAGYLQNGQVEQFIGAGLFLVSFAWSLYNKFTTNGKIETALELPAGSSREALNKELKLK